MFALPWYLTWFGHSLNQYKDVVRLYDFFLSTPPMMPLYVAASLVVERRDVVFEQGCDMAMIHCMLSKIPDDLDFEKILQRALIYYKNHPPKKLESDVKKRVKKEYVFDAYSFLRKMCSLLRSLFTLRFYLFFINGFFFRRTKRL